MKVVYTEEALKDLDAIADWLIVHYPAVAPAVERRIRSIIAHIARRPESSRRSAKHPGVRVVALGRYPYKIFYRVTDDRIEITPRGVLGTSKSEYEAASLLEKDIPFSDARFGQERGIGRRWVERKRYPSTAGCE